MNPDPAAAPRRAWRQWPWGWLALGLAVAAWACAAVLLLLFFASIGAPGDGDNALQATRIPILATLLAGGLMTLGGLVAGPVALRWGCQPVAGAIALALLLGLLALPLLSMMA